ncbi:MAG TPA: DUF3043 domain-containing protein [Actinotalea sp.]|nr:DUF3043 domain-containing protein [Actinotalea sp.]
MPPTSQPTPSPTDPTSGTGPVGKGHPTPTRKQSEAARRRPLVPTDRKAAAKAQKAAGRVARDREYQAMQTGDERFLPARDKGPVRRFVRDTVDARHNVGEYFLPVSIVMVFAVMFTGNNVTAGLAVIGLLYLAVAAAIIDAVILGRRLRRTLDARFGAAAVPKGTVMYGVLRAFQLRRMRLPKPQVARGEYPS